MEQAFFMIELKDSNYNVCIGVNNSPTHGMTMGLSSFTDDNALKFKHREDAEMFLNKMNNSNYVITEHLFTAPSE